VYLLEQFFNDNHIAWSRDTRHVTEGHVGIRCPWCATDDPGFHLGISEESGAYNCWRDGSHSGRRIEYLLAKLLHRPAEVCHREIRSYWTGKTPKIEFRAQRPISGYQKTLSLFRPAETSKMALSYLKERGFDDPVGVCRRYGLGFTHVGEFAFRLMIPYRNDQGDVVTFTARDLTGKSPVRYKSCPYSLSPVSINTLLFNAGKAIADTLVLTEGPFDVMKLETSCTGIVSWALGGLQLNPSRLLTISQSLSSGLVTGIRQIVIVLDSDQKSGSAVRMAGAIRPFVSVPVYPKRLPDGIKDFGSMGSKGIRNWVASEI